MSLKCSSAVVSPLDLVSSVGSLGSVITSKWRCKFFIYCFLFEGFAHCFSMRCVGSYRYVCTGVRKVLFFSVSFVSSFFFIKEIFKWFFGFAVAFYVQGRCTQNRSDICRFIIRAVDSASCFCQRFDIFSVGFNKRFNSFGFESKVLFFKVL